MLNKDAYDNQIRFEGNPSSVKMQEKFGYKIEGMRRKAFICMANGEIMDEYIVGLLHDVGRREGVTDMHHIISGYNFLKENGFDAPARICITHPFLIKELECYSGKLECSESELGFIKDYLRNIEFNDYDKLIQFCDAIPLPSGFCLIEKRMIDVALRYGINDLIIDRWKTTIGIKQYFESKMANN